MAGLPAVGGTGGGKGVVPNRDKNIIEGERNSRQVRISMMINDELKYEHCNEILSNKKLEKLRQQVKTDSVKKLQNQQTAMGKSKKFMQLESSKTKNLEEVLMKKKMTNYLNEVIESDDLKDCRKFNMTKSIEKNGSEPDEVVDMQVGDNIDIQEVIMNTQGTDKMVKEYNRVIVNSKRDTNSLMEGTGNNNVPKRNNRDRMR